MNHVDDHRSRQRRHHSTTIGNATMLSLMHLFHVAAHLALGSALLAAGCGGSAVDDPNNESDTDGGDGDTPVQDTDPLSNEGFPVVVTGAYDEYCANLEACDAIPEGLNCGNAVNDVALLYDIDSTECRGLILASLECINDSWSNCAISGDCAPIKRELDQKCEKVR